MKNVFLLISYLLFTTIIHSQSPCLPASGGILPGDEPPGCFLCSVAFFGSTEGYTPDTFAFDFPCGTVENSQWVSFNTDSTGSASFTFFADSCALSLGVHGAIYDTDFNMVSNCFESRQNDSTPDFIEVNGLVPDATYHLMVDGIAGDQCDFLITIPSGVNFSAPGVPSPIVANPDFSPACLGSEVCYSINKVPGATEYIWVIPFMGGISDGGGLRDTFICVRYNSPGGGVIRVQPNNDCALGIPALEPVVVLPDVLGIPDTLAICYEEIPLNYLGYYVDSFGVFLDTIQTMDSINCTEVAALQVIPEIPPLLIDTILCPGECIILGDSCYSDSSMASIFLPCLEVPNMKISFADTNHFLIQCLPDTFINALSFDWQVFGADSFSVFVNDEFQGNQRNSSFLLPIDQNLGDSVRVRVIPFNGLGCSFKASESICPIPKLTAVAESTADESVKIYPNPSTNLFQILSDELIEKVEVFTLAGKSILESFEPIIDLTKFPSGVYFFKIKMKKQAVIKKAVKF